MSADGNALVTAEGATFGVELLEASRVAGYRVLLPKPVVLKDVEGVVASALAPTTQTS
jgi:hypothetical protein